MGEVDIDNIPLEQAVATLGKASGTSVVADWEGLFSVGLTPGERVSLRARGIPLGDALDRLLQPFNESTNGPITYSAETGKVVIGPAERVAPRPVVAHL